MRTASKVVVIGGGHAGVEAASGAARLGVDVILVTLRKSGIGQMSCNPAIGGVGKGHLVREIDALGGIMGRAIDKGGIQFRTLNASKGPAVRASRAQADRRLYREAVLELLDSHPNITIVEGEVSDITAANGRVTGVQLADGTTIAAGSVIVTTGTFLRGLMHTGPSTTPGGRIGDAPTNHLSGALRGFGLPMGRLKTGTPPRLRKSTINTDILEPQHGDTPPRPFSVMTDAIVQPQLPCWLTSTNETVHDIVANAKPLSPLYNGQIESRGPRYCPSLEDKVFRFADKPRHTVFLEPEGYDSDVVYPNGISTSLPREVQQRFVREIRGLENVEILQYGYAVEYDFVQPTSLLPTLECKDVPGLYLAGQINGTSGYEEAAAQGIVAGINAACALIGRDPCIISRSEAYIGVLIDDLVTLGVDEPYRMFTSRAEYRLLLREDNAVDRLSPIATTLGILSPEQQRRVTERQKRLDEGRQLLRATKARPVERDNVWLEACGSAPIRDGVTLEALLRRPELSLAMLVEHFLPDAWRLNQEESVSLEVETKFAGYLAAQEAEVKRLRAMEEEVIPPGFPFSSVPNLRAEAVEKLERHRPHSLGQALRIPGMTPTAVSLLAIHLKRSCAR